MNWAHRLLHFTPEIEPIIASPLIVKNEFYDPDRRFLHSPFQYQYPADEWSFSDRQLQIAKAAVKIPLLYKFWLQRQIKQIKPSVLHIHFGNVAWEYSRLAVKADVPLIATFHGYDYRKILRDKPVFSKRYKQLFARAAAITCGGSDAKNYLISIGCPAAKINIVHMAIDTEKVLYRPPQKKRNELKLLQISSFVEKKGHIYTLRAFKKALAVCPNMTLTLIGEFVDEEILRMVSSHINAEGLEEKVEIIGSLSYSELLRRIPRYDVMIHPSVTAADTDMECTPVSMMDVQAVGLPVITTRHADIPEVVLHGKTGMLAEEKDTDTLTEYIHFFYKADTEAFTEYAEAARRHIEKEYDVRKSAAQFAELYRKVSRGATANNVV